MTTVVRAFSTMVADFARSKGPRAALFRAVGSARALGYPSLLRQLRAQRYLQHVQRKRGADGEPWDPFHFVSHPEYLVRDYSLRQRFRAALQHDRYEAATFDEAFLDRLYSARGFTLWSAEVDGHAFEIRMGPSGLETLEGDLYLRLFADGRPIGSINFVWSDAAMFGRPSAPTIFITRCQTHTWPEIQIFRASFKQNSPPYFGLAALSGIGMACGMRELYAVQARSQVHYDERYASSFANSYDEFWEKFQAERVGPEAFRLALPLALRDLSELKSKHRARAEGRRRAWGDVAQAAQAALAPYVRAEAGESLPSLWPAVDLPSAKARQPDPGAASA